MSTSMSTSNKVTGKRAWHWPRPLTGKPMRWVGLSLLAVVVLAFIASAVVVKPFLGVVRRSGFVPFAWYRIAAGLLLLAALAAGVF